MHKLIEYSWRVLLFLELLDLVGIEKYYANGSTRCHKLAPLDRVKRFSIHGWSKENHERGESCSYYLCSQNERYWIAREV